jgi:hypothetical protein
MVLERPQHWESGVQTAFNLLQWSALAQFQLTFLISCIGHDLFKSLGVDFKVSMMEVDGQKYKLTIWVSQGKGREVKGWHGHAKITCSRRQPHSDQ